MKLQQMKQIIHQLKSMGTLHFKRTMLLLVIKFANLMIIKKQNLVLIDIDSVFLRCLASGSGKITIIIFNGNLLIEKITLLWVFMIFYVILLGYYFNSCI